MSDLDSPVLVTGAAGYLASWVVAQLLDEGRTVHATVRSFADSTKLVHLRALEAAHPGRLKLFEADLMKQGSFDAAVRGCGVVIHVASPYFLERPKNFERDLLGPAREGTLNLIGAIDRAESVKRLVITASVNSLFSDARDLEGRPTHTVKEDDHNGNTDPRHNPYSYSKTAAEHAAREAQQRQKRWDLVTVHPGAIFGPSLSARRDATSVDMALQFLKGSFKAGVPRLWLGVVDVRDAAAVHVGAALRPEARGRYIAVGRSLTLLDIASSMRPKDHGLADKLPKKESPKFLIWLIAPFVGMTREYVKRNVGYAIHFDNSRSVSELAIRYRTPAETFNDQILQVVKDRLLEA